MTVRARGSQELRVDRRGVDGGAYNGLRRRVSYRSYDDIVASRSIARTLLTCEQERYRKGTVYGLSGGDYNYDAVLCSDAIRRQQAGSHSATEALCLVVKASL